MKHLLATCLLALASCATPLVSYAVVDGSGAVFTDGNALISFGSLEGEAGVFAKGSGFPVTLPLTVDEGTAFVYNDELGINAVIALTEPLPYWTRDLMTPAHQSYVEAALGVELIFEPITQP